MPSVPPPTPLVEAAPLRVRWAREAGIVTLVGALLWPVALWGDYDPREYVALLVGAAAMAFFAVVILAVPSARAFASAVIAGGAPVAALGAWWLVGDSILTDWPAVVSSGLLVAGGLLAAAARHDSAVVSAHRRSAVGLAVAGLLVNAAGLWAAAGAVAAVLAVLVMTLPMVVSFGLMAGRRLGTALATAALMLATSVVQTAFDAILFTPALLLSVLSVVLLGAAAVVAALNPRVKYRQVIPAAPAVIAAAVAIGLAGASVVLTATAAAALDGPTDPGPTASASPTSSPSSSASRTSSASPSTSPSTSPSSSPTPVPVTPTAVTPYPGQKPGAVPASVSSRCDVSAPRIICVDKSARRLYFVVDGKLMLTLDARFGGEANPTREGEFSVYRKDADHVSTGYGSNMPYAMFFSAGEAIHYSIDFATRGYAGHSHGCVNIRDKAALAWLFDQVPVGTPVTIWS